MTNGHIDEAEIDALLSGDQSLVDRYIVTGIRELKRGLSATTSDVKAMRAVCEQRGLMCPVMTANLADPVEPLPAAPVRFTNDDANKTFFMWTIGSKVGYLLVAAGVTVINVAINYLLFGKP